MALLYSSSFTVLLRVWSKWHSCIVYLVCPVKSKAKLNYPIVSVFNGNRDKVAQPKRLYALHVGNGVATTNMHEL